MIPVCYALSTDRMHYQAVLEHEGWTEQAIEHHRPNITQNKSEVTCESCLEYIHA